MSENGCFVLLVMMVFLVLLLVSVWFQLSTKLCVFSLLVQNKRAGTTR